MSWVRTKSSKDGTITDNSHRKARTTMRGLTGVMLQSSRIANSVWNSVSVRLVEAIR